MVCLKSLSPCFYYATTHNVTLLPIQVLKVRIWRFRKAEICGIYFSFYLLNTIGIVKKWRYSCHLILESPCNCLEFISRRDAQSCRCNVPQQWIVGNILTTMYVTTRKLFNYVIILWHDARTPEVCSQKNTVQTSVAIQRLAETRFPPTNTFV
jgi:hypothetical protein